MVYFSIVYMNKICFISKRRLFLHAADKNHFSFTSVTSASQLPEDFSALANFKHLKKQVRFELFYDHSFVLVLHIIKQQQMRFSQLSFQNRQNGISFVSSENLKKRKKEVHISIFYLQFYKQEKYALMSMIELIIILKICLTSSRNKVFPETPYFPHPLK